MYSHGCLNDFVQSLVVGIDSMIKKYIEGKQSAISLILFNAFVSIILSLLAMYVYDLSRVFAYQEPISYLLLLMLSLFILLVCMTLMYLSAWRHIKQHKIWTRYLVAIAIPTHVYLFLLAPSLIALTLMKHSYFLVTGEQLIIFDMY